MSSVEGNIKLYPNPNKGTFTLSVAGQGTGNGGATYIITDMLGNVIGQGPIAPGNQTIDMHEAAEGVYTLTVKGAMPQRFVVVR